MCDFCENKCNICKHLNDQVDIGDEDINLIDWCCHQYILGPDDCPKEQCECPDFETDWNFCPICGEKLKKG